MNTRIKDEAETRLDIASSMDLAEESRLECLKLMAPLFGSEERARDLLGLYFQAPARAGAYAGPLLAEPFFVRDRDIIRRVTIATQCFDLFAHCLDDVTDRSGDCRVEVMHAASYALSQGMSQVARLSRPGNDLTQVVDALLLQCSEAERSLIAWNKSISQNSIEDERIFGRKSAYLKLPIHIYTQWSEQHSIVPLLDDAIEWVCTGIQLVDDLTDWMEDLQSGCFTLPVKLAFARCRAASEEHIEAALHTAEVTCAVTHRAMEALRRGRDLLTICGARTMTSFVEELLERLSRICALTKRYNSLPEQEIREHLRKYLHDDMDPRLGH